MINTKNLYLLCTLGGLLFVLSACGGVKHDTQVQQQPSNNQQHARGLEEVVVSSYGSGMQKNSSMAMTVKASSATPYSSPPLDQSEYPEYKSNPIKLTVDEPVSTFSIDVDTSAYSTMRSHIQRGVLPPKNSVRSEEFINYFSYDYPLPKTKSPPFEPQIKVMDAPWSQHKKLIEIGLQGYDIKPVEQPNSNLVFLLDVSGSMSAQNKLPLLKKSIKLLLKSLKPSDMVSIVVYAGAAGAVLEPTAVSNKAAIYAALDKLHAGGGTAGGAGLELAYRLAKQNFDKSAVNRIFIATDGDFNVGASSNEDLKTLVERNRNKGIYLSVLGFGGNNYQDDMMQAIAQNGNGVAAYIDTLKEAKKVLVDEATSNLFTIASDVKIQVEFNPNTVAEYRLIGYETRALKREDFNNDKVDAGDVGAGHSVTAIYEITPVGAAKSSIDPLRYSTPSDQNIDKNVKQNHPQRKNFNGEYGFLKLRYKLPNENESTLMSTVISKQDSSLAPASFAVAVAGFSELLKQSQYIGDYSYEKVVELARKNKGDDVSGYRAEFIQLVEMASLLK